MNPSTRAYLDWNATTPVWPEVATVVAQAMMLCGNPSSVHAEGRSARAVIEDARKAVADLVGGSARNIVFTSGGTEAINAVQSPRLGATRTQAGPTRLLAGATEHACVLAGGQFAGEAITVLPVDGDGLLLLSGLEHALHMAKASGERILLSLQLANNETGVIQDVAAAAELVHAAGGLLHVDAVQAAGKIAIDIGRLGADALTLSAHKFGGPKGVGAIIFADESLRLGVSLIRGGGQERGQRAGTENVAGIAGMGVAARLALQHLPRMDEVARLRDLLQTDILRRAPDAVVFAGDAPRLPNTLCFAVPGLSAETALIGFDMDGVAVSSGSACSSGKVKPSHVLDAMRVAPALSRAAIRLSLGWTTTEANVAHCLTALENRLKTLVKEKEMAA